MRINAHIERLVLDDVPLAPGGRPLLKAAVEAELTRLLARGGLHDALTLGAALSNVRTAGIQLSDDGSPTRLGEQIAGAIYGGISR